MDTATGGSLGLLGVAVANGLVIAVIVTAILPISGGHINPAVTVALLLAKKIEGKMAAQYIVTQLLAAVAGALLLKVLFPAVGGEASNWGTPRIAGEITLIRAIVIEASLTVLLMIAVFGTAVSREAPAVGGFAIGSAVLVDILVGGPLTGAAMNPARAFGPALVSQSWEGHLTYWVGPIAGGMVGTMLWRGILLPRDQR